jgi:hypothetical protein
VIAYFAPAASSLARKEKPSRELWLKLMVFAEELA